MTNISWKNLFTPKYIGPFLYLMFVFTYIFMDTCSGALICFGIEDILFTIGSLPIILLTEPIIGYELVDRGLREYTVLVVLSLSFYFLIGLLLEIAFHKLKKMKASNSANSTNKLQH